MVFWLVVLPVFFSLLLLLLFGLAVARSEGFRRVLLGLKQSGKFSFLNVLSAEGVPALLIVALILGVGVYYPLSIIERVETAEKAAERGYDRRALIASFLGAFPMTSPRYVTFILLDEPRGTEATYGFASAGWTAAPTTGRIIARIAPLLGIEAIDEATPRVKQAMNIGVKIGRPRLASY